jgi:threonine dehydratase
MHDRPAELARLLSEIAAAGANVHTIEHDRTRRDVPIGCARVMLELETRGADHIALLRSHLASRGYTVVE